jgi:hypothetical protein
MTTRTLILVLAAGTAVASLVAVLGGSLDETANSRPRVRDVHLEAEAARQEAAGAAVRVEHDLIVAKVVGEVAARQEVPAGRRAPAAAPRKPAPKPGREAGFLSRARQLFVGDGRHRPAPFPRAGQ